MSVRHSDPDLGRLVRVELRRVPLDLYHRTRQHSEELQREFALVALGQEAGAESVPGRLLDFVNETSARFAGWGDPAREQLEQAARRGDVHADVTYVVPELVAPAAEELACLFDQADEFCRAGHLLTLAAPPDVADFRRWFLGEFTRQIAGQAPRAWPGTAGA